MKSSEIVEVYVAINAVEAHILCNALREADVEAQVVNDGLTVGSGVLPFGETVAPGIWVRSSDAPRARTIIAERLATIDADRDRLADSENEIGNDGEALPESPAESSEESASASSRPRSGVEKLLFGVAVALMIFGFFRAGRTLNAIRKCTAPIQAQLATSNSSGLSRYTSRYIYAVSQHTYEAKIESRFFASNTIELLYNPDAPEQYVLSPPPNWESDFFVGLAGAVLLFVLWRIG